MIKVYTYDFNDHNKLLAIYNIYTDNSVVLRKYEELIKLFSPFALKIERTNDEEGFHYTNDVLWFSFDHLHLNINIQPITNENTVNHIWIQPNEYLTIKNIPNNATISIFERDYKDLMREYIIDDNEFEWASTKEGKFIMAVTDKDLNREIYQIDVIKRREVKDDRIYYL